MLRLILVLALSTMTVFSAPQQVPAGVDPAACPAFPFCAVNSAALGANPMKAPAGVDLARCPGFPHCDNNALQSAPADPAARFPAGVDPNKCPGFPFQPCK